MDGFLSEAARDKKLTFVECPSHPVTLIRAIRSECNRVVQIAWEHPAPPVQFVAALYAAAIADIPDEELVATAIFRTMEGPLDAEWWEKRILDAVDEYGSNSADELAIQNIVQRDINDAQKMVIVGAARNSGSKDREG